jgi:hypothetical protein
MILIKDKDGTIIGVFRYLIHALNILGDNTDYYYEVVYGGAWDPYSGMLDEHKTEK